MVRVRSRFTSEFDTAGHASRKITATIARMTTSSIRVNAAARDCNCDDKTSAENYGLVSATVLSPAVTVPSASPGFFPTTL